MTPVNPKMRTDWTTDREGTELRKGTTVWVENDMMTLTGVVCEVETYRVMVMPNEESYPWAHVSDVTVLV